MVLFRVPEPLPIRIQPLQNFSPLLSKISRAWFRFYLFSREAPGVLGCQNNGGGFAEIQVFFKVSITIFANNCMPFGRNLTIWNQFNSSTVTLQLLTQLLPPLPIMKKDVLHIQMALACFAFEYSMQGVKWQTEEYQWERKSKIFHLPSTGSENLASCLENLKTSCIIVWAKINTNPCFISSPTFLRIMFIFFRCYSLQKQKPYKDDSK